MKIEFEISDELLQKILSYGDILRDDLTEEQLKKIQRMVAKSLLERIEDEPHYAYDDFINGVI